MEGIPRRPRFDGKLIRCPYCDRVFREGIEEIRGNANRTCLVCGHSWRGRGDGNPRRCPSCRSVNWNRGRTELECAVCGHVWVPRGRGRPKKCPACQATEWRSAEGKPASEPAAAVPPEDDGPPPLQTAMALYSRGSTCVEAAAATGVPVETLLRAITEGTSGPSVRMTRRSLRRGRRRPTPRTRWQSGGRRRCRR